MDGYILIHRKLLEWEWYSSVNDTRLFIHCLLKANWKDGRFKGTLIPRGSFVTSFNSLVKETGLTRQQVRTSLEHLKSTHEITHKTNYQYSIITINKYNEYQIDNTQSNQRLTNEQQTNNTNRIKEIKEIKNKESIKKVFTKPTLQEITDYCLERNNNVDAERFYNFYESKDWYVGKNKMKDWKACIRTWEQRDKVDVPSWFGKETEKKKLTEKEKLELNELFEES